MGGRTQGVDPGGNPNGKISNKLVGKGNTTNTVVICVGGTTRRTYLGNHGTPPKGERGASGYRDSTSDVEGMHGCYELKDE